MLSKPEDRLIVELCKRNFDGTSLRKHYNLDSLDWQYLLNTAARNMVAPIVFDRLLKIPLRSDIHMRLVERGKTRIAAVLHDNLIYKQELDRILAVLKAAGIQIILLKGLALGFPSLRATGDLDILVKKDALIPAINTLLKLDGYEFIEKEIRHDRIVRIIRDVLPSGTAANIRSQLSWNHEFQLYRSDLGVLVEVHTNLFSNRYAENIDTLRDSMELFWEESEYDSKLGCHTLSREHSVILGCLHAAVKRPPSNDTFRLRSLIDIDRLAADTIRWDVFFKQCSNMEISPYVYFSLRLAQAILGTNIPVCVFRELKKGSTRRQLLLQKIHMKSLGSLSSYSMVYANIYRIFSPFVFHGRFKKRIMWLFLIPLLVPPRERIAARYNMKEDSPLLYFAYLANLLRWAVLLMGCIYRIRVKRPVAR